MSAYLDCPEKYSTFCRLWACPVLDGAGFRGGHDLSRSRNMEVAQDKRAPQVNLARHAFLRFANGGLGNTR